jgi:hypothetical protein
MSNWQMHYTERKWKSMTSIIHSKYPWSPCKQMSGRCRTTSKRGSQCASCAVMYYWYNEERRRAYRAESIFPACKPKKCEQTLVHSGVVQNRAQSRIRGSVTNNNGFWIGWLDLLALLLQLQPIITAHNQWVLRTLSIPYWTTSVFSSTVTDLVLNYESVISSASVVRCWTLNSVQLLNPLTNDECRRTNDDSLTNH